MTHLRLETRITLLSAVVVALGILLCGIAATLYLHHERVEELDEQLTAEAGHFLDEWKRHGGPKFDWGKNSEEMREWSPAGHPPHFVEVADMKGRILYRTPEMPIQDLQKEIGGFRDIRVGGLKMRLAVFEKRTIVLRLVAGYEPIHELTQNLVMAFLVATPVILVFVFLGGRWIARQAVTPIQEIIASAERISTQHLEQRLPIPPVRDEIHRLATVLNNTLDRLDKGFRQATRFTADASHELKTPLTVLRTSLEAFFRSPELGAGNQQTVAGMIEQTKRLSAITTSLLLLSRADVGKLELELTPGNLSEIVGLCVEDARIVAEDREIQFSVDMPEEAPAMLEAARMAQVVMNILDNAIKYNRDGGSVRISISQTDGQWRVCIANTGAGIPPEVAGQLFTRFYRGEHTSTVGGHGLGLSLARELARAHHGELVFEESAGGWTSFVLTIPVLKRG